MKPEPSAEVRAFLDRVRDADGPTPERRARIHEQLQARLRAHGIHGLGAPRASAAGSGLGSAAILTGLRLSMAMVVGGLGAYVASSQLAPQRSENTLGAPGPEVAAMEPTKVETPGTAQALETRTSTAARVPAATERLPRRRRSLHRSSHARPPRSAPFASDPAPAVGTVAPARASGRAVAPAPARASASARASAPASTATHKPRYLERTGRNDPGADSGRSRERAETVQVAQTNVSRQATRPVVLTVEEPLQEPASERPKPPPAASLADEVALIRAARRGMQRGDHRAARRALDRHRKLFPRGALGEERKGLWLLLLCESASTPTTRALRDEFLEQAPDSVLASQVRRKCVEHGDGREPR